MFNFIVWYWYRWLLQHNVVKQGLSLHRKIKANLPVFNNVKLIIRRLNQVIIFKAFICSISLYQIVRLNPDHSGTNANSGSHKNLEISLITILACAGSFSTKQLTANWEYSPLKHFVFSSHCSHGWGYLRANFLSGRLAPGRFTVFDTVIAEAEVAQPSKSVPSPHGCFIIIPIVSMLTWSSFS